MSLHQNNSIKQCNKHFFLEFESTMQWEKVSRRNFRTSKTKPPLIKLINWNPKKHILDWIENATHLPWNTNKTDAIDENFIEQEIRRSINKRGKIPTSNLCKINLQIRELFHQERSGERLLPRTAHTVSYVVP